MIHPDTELCWISPEIGHGVRATRRIPRGTLTWVLCRLDRVLTEAQVEDLGPLYRAFVDRYAYVDHLGRRILCWDAGRNVNHHCDANSRGFGLEAQIAVRDIEAGEELTCDYGECNLEAELSCECGSPRCRGRVVASDLGRLAVEWDGEISEALGGAALGGAVPLRAHAALGGAVQLAQPLLPFTTNPAELAEILAGRASVPSIRQLAWR
jgi:hypothetical protein